MPTHIKNKPTTDIKSVRKNAHYASVICYKIYLNHIHSTIKNKLNLEM